MIIGTVRVEEAQAYTSHAGYHQFHADETQEEYGSFEVFFVTPEQADKLYADATAQGDWGVSTTDESDTLSAGWYWAAGFPGCLPDGDAMGPFASSQQAHEDADEWAPEYDA